MERWKEEARTITSIVTREGEPPTVLASAADAKAHFRQHYFEGLLRTGTTLKVHGSVARNLPEPATMQAIRQAHETELRYPAQFVQLLRQGLQNAGLHIFKHRKRVVYVSLARPTPFTPDGAVSENVAAILETVAEFPLCTRKALAERVLSRPVWTGVRIGTCPAVKPAGGAPEASPASAPPPEAAASATPPESVDELPPEAGSAPDVSNVAPPAADDPLSKAKPPLPPTCASSCSPGISSSSTTALSTFPCRRNPRRSRARFRARNVRTPRTKFRPPPLLPRRRPAARRTMPNATR